MAEFADEQDAAARLGALQRFGIADSAVEPEFEAIALRAATACATPMAMVTFVTDDKLWIKAAVGAQPGDSDREVAFCTWAVHNAQVLCIEDAAKDERFRDNPLVLQEPHIRYYAGAPIPTPEGFMLGTVCVLDRRPRPVEPEHISTLQACAQEVSAVLMRRTGGGPLREAGV